MSDILFPPGFIVDLPRLDVEMMQHNAKMWDVEHTQLSKGIFEGNIFVAHTPRIQMGNLHFSHAAMTQGSFPQGCVVLYYYSSGSSASTYNFQGRIVSPNEIVILREGDELDRITYAAIDFEVIAIEKDLFYKTFTTFFGETPDTHIQNKRLYLEADKIELYRRTHTSWVSYLVEEYPKLINKPDYDKIESEILHQLFSCMRFDTTLKKRKKFQIKKVRDILHENIDNSIDMTMLAEAGDIGLSQLHQVFKKEYGITPKKYLQLLRFNAIRKELLYADPHATSISDLAIKYDFLQMGHFAAGYKQLFGETPSQTLCKKR